MSHEQLWRVELTSPAVRDLGRIPPRYAGAIAEFLTAVLPTNPPRVGKPMRNELEGFHSARRGEYRVLYRIDHEQRAACVVRIDHCGSVYKNR